MKIKFGYIIYIALLLTTFSCSNFKEPEFKILSLDKNDKIEFQGKKNLSQEQLENSLDSLIKLNDQIYLMLDIADESSYVEFYSIRKILQKHRDKLLISLKQPVEEINYYTISAEPEKKELNRFSEIQTIEINRAKSGAVIINKDSTILKTELQASLLKESKNLLSKQTKNGNTDSVLMFWINIQDYTTNQEYKLLRENLNKVISELKNENEEIITRIIELKKKMITSDDEIRFPSVVRSISSNR